jgi:hypothetical protein
MRCGGSALGVFSRDVEMCRRGCRFWNLDKVRVVLPASGGALFQVN